METFEDSYPYAGRMAVQPLRVIVVGAGITGLATGLALSQTGHSVTILESASDFTEVGAGMQLPPNACRILHRLGLLEQVLAHTSLLSKVSIRRYNNDEEFGTTPLMPELGYKYKAPMGVIHRQDLQNVLLNAARRNGCSTFTSQQILAADAAFRPRVLCLDRITGAQRWLAADVVIAADGIRSTLRKQMAKAMGITYQPEPTGDAAYRLLIPRERVVHDKTLLEMLDQDIAMRYMGPGGHVMAYPLKQNSVYNIVLLHPDQDTSDDDCWTSQGNHDAMLDFYKSWSPAIRAWLSHADTKVLEWRLKTHKPLPSWVQGSVVLAGDACHPMLPYVAQGAASGIEDAAALAMVFTCTSNISLALAVYQVARKERAERIAASALETGRVLHLPDGPEQQERDGKIVRNSSAGDKWQDSQWQDYMWKTDVMRDVVEGWDGLVTQTGHGCVAAL